MCSMVEERISAWRDENDGNLPAAILFYRDGVSESQFRMCEIEEVGQIRQAYKNLGGEKEVKITFIVVGKRHHTRFYPTDAKDSSTYNKKTGYDQKLRKPIMEYNRINGNLRPGLLVDNTVTNPSPKNFFLQSHVAVQGTARPAH